MGNFLEDIIESDLSEKRVDKIITRFPPEPNGCLHIGHAKAICLNYGLAKKYNGKFNLRFDDTNPEKEDDEFVKSIIKDVQWLLGDDSFDIFYASDYFDEMYRAAVVLIEKGLAYVDDITPEQMSEMRGTLTKAGQESKARNTSVKENLELFEKMRSGFFNAGERVLRAKINMASPNMNMRDPIIYRVVKAVHHRQKDKWCIYPMYDFAHPIEDAVENITHSICTLEFEDHRPLYDWVLDNVGYNPRPHQYEFARLNIARTIMSKRYLKKLVDEKFVDGWDDPRMPTLSGLRRRGYSASSIREFCERIGVTKANGEVETASLESCIRDELNLNAERAMAVIDPIPLTITNLPDDYSEELDFEYSIGEISVSRKISFSNKLYIEREDFALNPPPKYKRLTIGGLTRLKSAYIVKCTDAKTDANGNVTEVFAELIPGTKSGEVSDVKAKGVIHFVDAKNAVDIKARLYDYILTEENTKTDFSERLNKESLKECNAKAEKYIESANKGTSFQFLRKGYFVRDEKSSDLVFNEITGLKDTFKSKSFH